MSLALVAPADGPTRGAGQSPAPTGYLPVEYAPLRRKVKGGEVPPSFTARFLLAIERCQVALHEDADRAMVTEGYPH